MKTNPHPLLKLKLGESIRKKPQKWPEGFENQYSTVSVQYADPYLQKIDNLKIYPNKTQIQAEGKKVVVAVALKINFNKILLPAALCRRRLPRVAGGMERLLPSPPAARQH